MNKHAPDRRGMRWVFWAFLAIAGFFLWTEHRAHLLGALPYLLLLACPLMHLFHGHGGHGGHEHSTSERQPSEPPSDTGSNDGAHRH